MTRITNAFVIRPFNEKSGMNFETTHAQLIQPALEKFGVEKMTTLDIFGPGNIRTDMFRLLLTADVVIADLSIHNANVFYELGIRHSLVKKHTILIRANIDKIPFDLLTDRYLAYDAADPAACLDSLVKSIDAALHSTHDTDSPVFSLLPGLVEQDAESFLVVPPRFTETVSEVRAAKIDKESKIADLALFATEIAGLPWEIAGLRHVGRALFQLKAYEPARESWERIRRTDANDVEANHFLSTIYQRLGELQQADNAIDRVLSHPRATKTERSEALALRGRNAKSQWLASWRELPSVEQKRDAALTSPFLAEACDAYHQAFLLDLHNFYPGLNALACALLIVQLAKEQPELWEALHDKPPQELERFSDLVAKLPGAVRISIEAKLPDADDDTRKWAECSLADLAFCSGMNATVVAKRYKQKTADISEFQIGSVRDQLELFRGLGIFTDAATAALEAIKQGRAEAPVIPPHVLLFTGHRVDDLDRATPRFPESKVAIAQQEIEAAIDDAIKDQGDRLLGIAGAASGGDILFHETCRRRGIPTEIYLALDTELYAAKSVQPSGGNWVRRYHDLLGATKTRILQEDEDLPDWLFDKKSTYSVWERTNLWMLSRAMVHGGGAMTLLALWNGQTGDGPGGTKDMLDRARKRGAQSVVLGTGTIF
ncbi:MAG: hypothetical protein QOH21_578 [Acidobacteriota bacterium]|jgi:tetratricopeptide (TPR) repeat protein|nr:hypothetical protein [Acidobacteriota bacterium]